MKKIMLLLWSAGIVIFLSACSTALDTVENSYPLKDIVYDASGNESKIYQAIDTPIKKTVDQVTNEEEPMDISKKEDRAVLVYDEYLVQVYSDIKEEDNTLVEVSDENFVRQNYTADFFETYGIADSAEDAYDMNLDDRNGANFFYFGYIGSGGHYVRNAGVPSVRFGSNSTNGVRGGGPGAGK